MPNFFRNSVIFCLFACFFVSALLRAWAVPSDIKVGPDGRIKINKAVFEIFFFNNAMRSYGNWIFRDGKISGNDFRAAFQLDGVKGTYQQTLSGKNGRTMDLNAVFRFDAPYHGRRMTGAIILPTDYREVKINGNSVELPAQTTNKPVFQQTLPAVVEIDLAPGKRLSIRSGKGVVITDLRPYKQNGFRLGFPFTPADGPFQESRLELQLDYGAALMTPLDISAAANRSFCDDEDGSGWTGQGDDNDLRSIPTGKLESKGFVFNILPAMGKSAIVIGGEGRKGFPASAEIPVPEKQRGRGINLLHACAWPPLGNEKLGEIEVVFRDGSKQVIPIRYLHDCGNWWAPRDMNNAITVYRHELPQNSVGLYGSGFELKRDDPKLICLKNTSRNSAWMIGGVSLSDIPVLSSFKEKPNICVTADRDWFPVDFKSDTIPGSPLDFSWIADAPAGKYGFITASKDGRLSFANAPGKNIRLFGANLCYSTNFLPREECGRLALSLRRQGYNAVRLHHFDSELPVSSPDGTLSLNPEKLDKFDYLVASLKEQGLYITFDLISSRKIKKSAKFPNDNLKTLVAFSPEAMDSWKDYARKLLTHRNPYTGMTYAEDPAIYCIVLLNENSQCVGWNSGGGRGMFEKWKQENNQADATADISDYRFRRFINGIEIAALQEEIRFVREELKLKCLLSSLNYGNFPELVFPRSLLDVVDNHGYFDHPSFPEKKWSLPIAHTQANPISSMAGIPSYVAPGRITGKPFMMTEYNYCYPNIYRSAGGAIAGAYSSLQDYSAMFRFAWAHYWKFVVEPNTIRTFDIVNDPMARLSDKFTAAMFVRGDVKSSEARFSVKIPADFPQKGDPREYSSNLRLLSLIAGIGSHTDTPVGVETLSLKNSSLPESLKNPAITNAWQNVINNKIAISSTGEISLNGKSGAFSVITPRTEAVCFKSGQMSAKLLTVSESDTFATVGAISLDGNRLLESKSILVLHLTNTVNSDSVMNHNWTLLVENGKRPILARRGKARISLNIPKKFKVTALAFNGAELGQVEPTYSGNGFSFTANTACYPGGVMAYHLTTID